MTCSGVRPNSGFHENDEKSTFLKKPQFCKIGESIVKLRRFWRFWGSDFGGFWGLLADRDMIGARSGDSKRGQKVTKMRGFWGSF